MRLPEWIREETRKSRGGHELKRLLRAEALHTVCEEARCPNTGRCFSRSTAAFLVLGDRCTRSCGFCAVNHAVPAPPDLDEPRRVAMAAGKLGLRYVVVTSVTRDDLEDGGANHFVDTIAELRRQVPGVRVEVLVPDFGGDGNALAAVIEARPDVLNHNMETVRRNYPSVRPQADYQRSLDFLAMAKRLNPDQITKSGLMVGLGETFKEVVDLLGDLQEAGCNLVTIGQYLRPRNTNLPVMEYVKPGIFDRYRIIAEKMGFAGVASAPLVRSSMDAEEMINA